MDTCPRAATSPRAVEMADQNAWTEAHLWEGQSCKRCGVSLEHVLACLGARAKTPACIRVQQTLTFHCNNSCHRSPVAAFAIYAACVGPPSRRDELTLGEPWPPWMTKLAVSHSYPHADRRVGYQPATRLTDDERID